MNEREHLDRLDRDKQLATGGPIVYLEGKNDPPIFFSLLGVAEPLDQRINGVKVIGLRDGRSGSAAVASLVRVAQKYAYQEIYGITDGDGDSLDSLSKSFDEPFAGPLFRWKAYCIENLLVKLGVPTEWNINVDWPGEFHRLAPYVALKRLVRSINKMLDQLGLANLLTPPLREPYREDAEFRSTLVSECDQLRAYDVLNRYVEELESFRLRSREDLEEAHTFVDGKWLVEKVAPRLTNRTPDQCRSEWIRHATSLGGLPEVRLWWTRIMGSPP